ncbi:hypothetical protein SPRG_14493 [Saprolegnia parasitica CBS 223.65]|uniref:Myb-like domain-containing protein n=1 Tax=Saprolegnia parasitica (strain CBS 223.65) TaxID=695850 RepID=A0A067C0C3_SAPPC|nr:hypothetical protein SPRG_14493 [Saprolegnia parasitica CBS 223.65]KDO20247.1 hypothetical protein SPRG_14493 [Saprolegnia parasitica CBS 223.65]|eukprot:XP_012209059.1 hypothetical protein SPRG_14493 [Saprolegnia parasitica CBS 223.65]
MLMELRILAIDLDMDGTHASWSRHEDALLCAALHLFPSGPYDVLADWVPTRSPGDIRDRLRHAASPRETCCDLACLVPASACSSLDMESPRSRAVHDCEVFEI